MPITLATPDQLRHARQLVTDLDLACGAPHSVRQLAWATLKLDHHNRLMAILRHTRRPGDAA